MEARQVRVPQQRTLLGRRRVIGFARKPKKSSRPESERSRELIFAREAAQHAVQIRPVFRFLSAHRSFVLSFPLFRLSRSEAPPADGFDPHAEGDVDFRHR